MIQGIYYHAILSYFSASLPDTMEQGMALDDKAATLENAEIMNETKNDRITQHAHKICLALSKTTQVVFEIKKTFLSAEFTNSPAQRCNVSGSNVTASKNIARIKLKPLSELVITMAPIPLFGKQIKSAWNPMVDPS